MNFWRVPLDAQQVSVARGIVNIIEDRCKGCGYCIAYCPKEVLAFSDRFNKKGYHPPYAKRPEECVNCHYCEILCPEFAIFTVPDPSCPQAKDEEKDKQPGQSN